MYSFRKFVSKVVYDEINNFEKNSLLSFYHLFATEMSMTACYNSILQLHIAIIVDQA